MTSQSITQEHLKSILHYSKGTGYFTWLKTGKGRRVGQNAGSRKKSKYVYVCIDGKLYLAHRLAFLYMTGAFPQHQTDHINHHRDDNRWINLRAATRQENGKNQSQYITNKSGITGISRDKKNEKWEVYINSNKKRVSKTRHLDFFEACCARKSLENKYNFHENHGKSL